MDTNPRHDIDACPKPICFACGEQAARELANERAGIDAATADRLGLR